MGSDIIITERNYHNTSLGQVLQIKVFAPDYRLLSWREVWEVFVAHYPDRWAVQIFPPRTQLIDGKNVYHLFVCETEPQGFNLH